MGDFFDGVQLQRVTDIPYGGLANNSSQQGDEVQAKEVTYIDFFTDFNKPLWQRVLAGAALPILGPLSLVGCSVYDKIRLGDVDDEIKLIIADTDEKKSKRAAARLLDMTNGDISDGNKKKIFLFLILLLKSVYPSKASGFYSDRHLSEIMTDGEEITSHLSHSSLNNVLVEYLLNKLGEVDNRYPIEGNSFIRSEPKPNGSDLRNRIKPYLVLITKTANSDDLIERIVSAILDIVKFKGGHYSYSPVDTQLMVTLLVMASDRRIKPEVRIQVVNKLVQAEDSVGRLISFQAEHVGDEYNGDVAGITKVFLGANPPPQLINLFINQMVSFFSGLDPRFFGWSQSRIITAFNILVNNSKIPTDQKSKIIPSLISILKYRGEWGYVREETIREQTTSVLKSLLESDVPTEQKDQIRTALLP